MSSRNRPELSIVVPTFNEAATLPVLFDALSRQSNLDFELIIVDGGSTDATLPLVESYTQSAGFPVSLHQSGLGRGLQMNTGADRAQGLNLLFLHADSCFSDPYALSDGIFFFNDQLSRREDESVAGHFALRFMGTDIGPSLAYAYYETKARLARPGCIHGDQGFLLRRSFFVQVGQFDVSLPYLEDEIFVRSVAEQGDWILLPADIQTSSRRFQQEGLLPRQLLNALILTASAAGLDRFLHEAPGIYRLQGEAERLDLLPFLRHIQTLMRQRPWRDGVRTWYRAGRFVRDNGWQLLLLLDVWLGGRRQDGYRGEKTPVLQRFELWYDRLTDHPPGRLLWTATLWLGFHGALRVMQLRKKVGQVGL